MKLFITLLLIAMLSFSCTTPPPKVFFLNSYHEGYGSSDEITAGIQETLLSAGVDFEVFYMDTKRQYASEYLEDISNKALAAIEIAKPDVIIASDDNAVKYVVAPNFKDGPIPVVFCGVNWDCEQYGLPTENVTGMLEVLPLDNALATLKQIYTNAKTLTILSENTTSEHNNKRILDPLYKNYGFTPTYALVDNYSDWKKAFQKANKTADLIFFVTQGAIKYWNAEDARTFIEKTIKKPVFTADDFMMDYAVLGFTKVAKEQGVWAAEKAIEIINGTSPKDMAVTKNQQARLYINQTLADKIKFKQSTDLAIEFETVQ